jgi:hypothetical protein
MSLAYKEDSYSPWMFHNWKKVSRCGSSSNNAVWLSCRCYGHRNAGTNLNVHRAVKYNGNNHEGKNPISLQYQYCTSYLPLCWKITSAVNKNNFSNIHSMPVFYIELCIRLGGHSVFNDPKGWFITFGAHKHNFLETGFCLRLHVKPSLLDPAE